MRSRVVRIILWIFGGLGIALLFAFLIGIVVMALWNWLMPTIFGLPTITYWQAWGLLILSHILFKFVPGRGRHSWHRPPYREAWKEKFKARFKGSEESEK